MTEGWSLPSGKLLYRMMAYRKKMSKAGRVILAAIVLAGGVLLLAAGFIMLHWREIQYVYAQITRRPISSRANALWRRFA